jgi:hypothetical protein
MTNERSSAGGTRWPVVGMLRICEAPGCTTMTLGGLCVAHDQIDAPERDVPSELLVEPEVAVGGRDPADLV